MKNELRTFYREVRKKIIINPKLYAEQLDKIITIGSTISIYYPLKYELNILDILQNIKEYSLALPIVQDENSPLLFHSYSIGQTILHKNRFKTLEPIVQKDQLMIPQFCIVPLVCFDPITKHRLGYGGGYYDRTIEHYRRSSYLTKFIGLGHELLKVQGLPFDKFDQELDFVVTENNIYQ